MTLCAPVEDIKEHIFNYVVEPLFGSLKTSFVWHNFGNPFMVKGKIRRHICRQHYFCKLCLLKIQEREEARKDGNVDDLSSSALENFFSLAK